MRTSAPASSLLQRALIAFVRGYRLLLSPWLGNACRFEPTCSVYSIEAIEQHGAAVGSYLTLHRLARCQPLCAGGHDPVPACAADRLPLRGLRGLFRGLATEVPAGAGPSLRSTPSTPSTDKTSP